MSVEGLKVGLLNRNITGMTKETFFFFIIMSLKCSIPFTEGRDILLKNKTDDMVLLGFLLFSDAPWNKRCFSIV